MDDQFVWVFVLGRRLGVMLAVLHGAAVLTIVAEHETVLREIVRPAWCRLPLGNEISTSWARRAKISTTAP